MEICTAKGTVWRQLHSVPHCLTMASDAVLALRSSVQMIHAGATLAAHPLSLQPPIFVPQIMHCRLTMVVGATHHGLTLISPCRCSSRLLGFKLVLYQYLTAGILGYNLFTDYTYRVYSTYP
jgi:hypothetical protein